MSPKPKNGRTPSRSSKKQSNSKDGGRNVAESAIDTIIRGASTNEKHDNGNRRPKKTTSSHHVHKDNSSKNSDDDDDRSTSTASTFSYIQSILDRRRHFHFPKPTTTLPVVHEGDDDDGTAVGVVGSAHHRASSKRTKTKGAGAGGSHHRNSRKGEHTSKRKHRRRHDSKSKFHPLILLALLGLASNWLATRILNAILLEEIDNDPRSMNNFVRVHDDDLGDANVPDERDSLDDLSMGRDTGAAMRGIGWGRVKYEPMQQQYDGALVSNDYRNRGSDRQNNRVSPGSPFSNRTNNLRHESDELLTKRFVAMRRRLLELYSLDVPSNIQSYNATHEIHPLFDPESPQYRALDWLANVDGLRLRHYDPGLVQRYVLAVLYFSTGGPTVTEDTDLTEKHRGPWRNPTMWLAPTHECEWKSRIIDGAGRGGGIRRCDKNKTVVEISLYNELSGTIPSELGRLWNLRTLYLGRNHLTGTIPTELGMIQKLSSLSLQHNDLTGTIPQEHLKNLLTLRALQVEGNEKLRGKVDRHSLLCQMRNNYRGPTPKKQERYTGRRVLRLFTATCVPSSGSAGVSDRLECACCTECFGKQAKDLIY